MTTINHEYYVSLEVAKLLKEAGFVWETEFGQHIWDRDIRLEHNINFNSEKYLVSLPTLEVAQRWLRNVKGFEIFVGFTKHDFGNGNEKAYFYDCYEIPENEDAFEYFEDIYYHSYEEAQEAGIKKALEIILEK